MIMSEHSDVVVVGGGAGGIAAAIGAANAGATVCLIEQYPYLGGAATNSSVLTFCGFFDQKHEQVVDGVGGDILRRLKARGVYEELVMGWTGNRIVLLDLETTKLVCDQAVAEAGVNVRLHTRLIRAASSNGRVTSIEVNHRGGNEVITADAFVDASGDGVLSAYSGAGIHQVPVARRQTNTLICRFGGVAPDADLSKEKMRMAVTAYTQETGSTLVRDSGIAVRLPITGEVIALVVDEHFDTLKVAEISRAEASGRAQAWEYLEAFRKHIPGWEGVYLTETGPQIGIRESRRLQGRATISVEDVLRARKQPVQSIGRCGWPIEDHAGPGVTNYTTIEDGSWYDIPYGAICSQTTDNLWGVGRLISSDDDAFASVRVMGTAFATGHAAGIAAAQYIQGRPHDIGGIQNELTRQGAKV